MNTKDYKEIAKIINARIQYKAGLTSLVYREIEIIAKDLADYFEKEDFKNRKVDDWKNKFDREQFLKECGIEQ